MWLIEYQRRGLVAGRLGGGPRAQPIELIEDLVIRGGGNGLFTGYATGDTAMSVIVEVTGG